MLSDFRKYLAYHHILSVSFSCSRCFSLRILRDMEAHSEEIDDVIRANLKGWTIARVPRVSLVALRVALAEMMYGEEKKTSVAINEAVELVKKYGSDKDYQFVNGLLGTVARAQDKPAEE